MKDNAFEPYELIVFERIREAGGVSVNFLPNTLEGFPPNKMDSILRMVRNFVLKDYPTNREYYDNL